MSKVDVIAALGPCDLTYAMKSDEGPPGLCSVSAGLLSGLIEVRVSGRVSNADTPDRVPTRTDGVVASDIVDRWVSTARAEARAQDIADRLPFRDYFRSDSLLGGRNAELALDPGEFRTLQIELNLSGGAKSGSLFFAIPAARAKNRGAEGNTAEEFRCAVIQNEARLNVILARLPRSIAEVRRMAVGDVLEIPIETLRAVTVEGMDGTAVATGRLGQLGGQKAVRVEAPEIVPESDEAVLEFLSTAVGPAADLAIGANDLPEMPGATELSCDAVAPDASIGELPELPDLPASPDPAGLPDLPELPNPPDPPN